MKCLFRSHQSRFLRLAWGAVVLLLSGTVCLGADPAKTELAAKEARKSPDWLTRGVIYQVWLRAYTPEGTLRAATKRLPTIAELGANIVYLGPFMLADDDLRQEFWSPRQKASGTNNPRNPYRMKDYNRVDPEYGTEEDLREFVETAHKLNLRVLFDLVYFHCGPSSVLMDKPGFIQRDASGKAVTGSWAFPRLNFENRELREYLLANMEHWVKNFQVDGFRCDVADLVPLDFWEEARARLDPIRPDLVMLSEGQRAADQVSAFDINYGFSWYNTTRAVLTKSEPASAFRTLWEKQAAARPRGARFTRHTDNHDIANDMLRPDVLFGEQAAQAMSVINFTIDGVPFLYNGQEIGDTNRHSIFGRWPIAWQAACLPKSQATLKFYKQLCQLRRDEPALYGGEVVWVDHDQPDAVVAFCRRVGKEEILSVVNLSNRAIKVRLDLPGGASYKPLLSHRAKVGAAEEKAVLDLQGLGYLVGKK
jgi:cyclomaltodextrinase